MQGQRGEPVVRQRADDFLGVAAHVAEHHRRFRLELQQQRGELRRATRGIGLEEMRADGGRLRAAIDADFQWLAQHRLGQRADAVGERRREQQRLPLLGRALDQRADRFVEAHVEHAVGFVQHQGAHLAQVQRLLLHQFQHAAGRADHHVRCMRERGELRPQRNAAAKHRELEVGDAGGQLAQLLADLVGEFAGGAEHQGLGAGRGGIDALQQAQPECRGLAAAGRRLRDQVPAFEHGRERLRLDRRQRGVVECVEAGFQGRIEGEVGEGDGRGHARMIAFLVVSILRPAVRRS